MPEFLSAPFLNGPDVTPLDVLVRLLIAFVLGCGVAFIYSRTRRPEDREPSFATTLVLLSILIAVVTQVIGDNVARAFSLVGALGIVRFRTVVRDTQDTAYVIFSVVIGMAVGAKNLWVAVIAMGVVGLAAVAIRLKARRGEPSSAEFTLNLRVGLGVDIEKLLGNVLAEHLISRELVATGTARQGAAVDSVYRARLRNGASGEQLVRALNRVEGVQNVQLERRDLAD